MPVVETRKSFCRTVNKSEKVVNKEVLPKTTGLIESLAAQLDNLQKGLLLKAEYSLPVFRVPKQFKLFDPDDKDYKLEGSALFNFGLDLAQKTDRAVKPPTSFTVQSKVFQGMEQLLSELGQVVAYLDHFRTASLSLLEMVSTGLRTNMQTQDDHPVFKSYMADNAFSKSSGVGATC